MSFFFKCWELYPGSHPGQVSVLLLGYPPPTPESRILNVLFQSSFHIYSISLIWKNTLLHSNIPDVWMNNRCWPLFTFFVFAVQWMEMIQEMMHSCSIGMLFDMLRLTRDSLCVDKMLVSMLIVPAIHHMNFDQNPYYLGLERWFRG